jgi:predicted ABC-type ATPase
MRKLERPSFWIVAGPNGSGKSTFYDRTDIEGFGRSIWIINPDVLTAHICDQEDLSLLAANMAALDRLWKWLRASIRVHHTVGVETVLSTPKYRQLVRLAVSLGFEIRLLFITLESAEMNIERVRLRVAKGGHGVAETKIRARRERSYAQLPWFLKKADFALIYDNSGAAPKVLCRKQDGKLEVDPGAPPEILTAANKSQR